MAVVTLKSTQVTNADATPAASTSSYIHGGRVRESRGIASIAAGDDDGSHYRIARLPSNALISEFLVKHAAVTGGTDFNIGVYAVPDDGDAVVDDNAIADAIDMSSARTGYTDISALPASAESRLWELAGESSDPQVLYDVALTAITVGAATVSVACCIRYVE